MQAQPKKSPAQGHPAHVLKQHRILPTVQQQAVLKHHRLEDQPCPKHYIPMHEALILRKKESPGWQKRMEFQ